jgi:hypothetical protein
VVIQPFIGTAKAVVAPVKLFFCFSFFFWNVFRDLYFVHRRQFSNTQQQINVTSEQSFRLVVRCGD